VQIISKLTQQPGIKIRLSDFMKGVFHNVSPSLKMNLREVCKIGHDKLLPNDYLLTKTGKAISVTGCGGP
jgi:hypothetical protein